MRQPRFLLAFVLGALVGAGCNPYSPEPANDEPGTAETAEQLVGSWQLEVLQGKAVEPPGGKGMASKLTLSPDGKASGFGGCNQFSVTYERQGRDLSFGTITSTKMACPDMMDMERGFFTALEATRRYRIEDGRLELLDGQGATLARLRFDETPSKSPEGR